MICISHYPTMSGDVEFVTTEFDIFAHKPVQTAILETNVHYKPIATVDQTDLEFSIPADRETSIDRDIKLCKRQVDLCGRKGSGRYRFYGWNE
jgi:hypothetical protein